MLNNGWLQELPEPVTKLVWDNAALMSYTTMNRLGLTDGQIVNLKRGSFIVEMPVAGPAGPCRRFRHGSAWIWARTLRARGQGRGL